MLSALVYLGVPAFIVPIVTSFQVRLYANNACDASALLHTVGDLHSNPIYPIADSDIRFTDGCRSIQTFEASTFENGDSLADGAASLSAIPIMPEVRSKDRVEAYATEDCSGPFVASLSIGETCASTDGARIRSVLVKRNLNWTLAWQTWGFKHEVPVSYGSKQSEAQGKHGQISVWSDTVVKLWQKSQCYVALVPLEIWDDEVYVRSDKPCPEIDKDSARGSGVDLTVSKSFCENGMYGTIYRQVCEEKGYVPQCEGSWVVDEQGLGTCVLASGLVKPPDAEEL